MKAKWSKSTPSAARRKIILPPLLLLFYCPPFLWADVSLSLSPYPRLLIFGLSLGFQVGGRVEPRCLSSSVDLRESCFDHFQIDVLPIYEDLPQDTVVPIHAVALDLHGLVQDQPGQMLCGPLTEGLLSGFALLAYT